MVSVLLHLPLLFSWLYTGIFLLPQDGNGYIDENELDALLKDLCEKNKQVFCYHATYFLGRQ